MIPKRSRHTGFSLVVDDGQEYDKVVGVGGGEGVGGGGCYRAAIARVDSMLTRGCPRISYNAEYGQSCRTTRIHHHCSPMSCPAVVSCRRHHVTRTLFHSRIIFSHVTHDGDLSSAMLAYSLLNRSLTVVVHAIWNKQARTLEAFMSLSHSKR